MTSRKVAVVDHGTGNLFSVARALEYIGAEPEFVSTAEGILDADRLVLPGVGAFGNAMSALRQLGLVEPIQTFVKDKERPLLGICLGMQMLFEGSEEMGLHQGLGIVSGTVRRVPIVSTDGSSLKVPHIGWNRLLLPDCREDWLGTDFAGVEPGDTVYFVHSFAGEPDNKASELADCEYGGHRICVAVEQGSAIGCQFHPERSGVVGLSILRAFAER